MIGAVERALALGRPAQPGAPPPLPAARRGDLSPREAEVLALMVEGLHNRQIAERLGISPRTVEVHKSRVMNKLGASSLVDLVRMVDRGLV